MGGQLGSEQKPYRTGITFQGVTPPVPSQGSPGSTAINDVDLSSFLQAGVGGEQTQPQVTNQGPTPLDDFISGVETIVQQDTNFNQDGLADEYNKDIGMPNYLSRAAEMYSKDNEELSKAFGLYGGVTGGITDADVSVKLENLPPEAYNQLQRNYADLLRQSAVQRRASQPYDYNQFNPLSESFDPTSAIANLTPVTSSIGRGVDNAAQGLAGLGAGVVGLGAKALGALIPGQDMVDEFADKAFDYSQQRYHESGKKYVDINQSIAEDSPLNIWNPNNFSTTLYNALSMGTELGVTALIPFLKVGGVAEAAITKFGAKQALNAISNHIAKTLKVANVGIAKGFRDALARATLQEIKTGGLNIPGVGQLSPSMVMASLQAGARGLATAMTLSPGALFGTYQKSNGDIPNVFNAFNEGGNEELRKTDFLSVANRFWQDIAAEAALAPVLGVGVGAVKSLGTNIVANGVNLKEIKKALPALPPSETAKVIELATQLRHQAVAQEVFKVAEIHNIQVELPQANIGKAFAKWTMDEVKPKSTGTFNVKGQPGTHPDVTKVLEDYSKVQNKLVEDLKNVKTKAEATKLIQQAEIEFAQVADFAKAVTSESNGELKRIAKTRVPAKDISEGIENLVKTNNGGFIPVSLEKTNVATTVNSLIDTDTPSTLLPKLNKEIKLLMEKVKQPVPTDSKLLPGYTKELENNKSLLKQKNLELRQQKNLQEAKSRSNLLTQIMDKQKEIQEIVEGTRLQVQEGTVKKNLAKAEKIINAHNAEVSFNPKEYKKAVVDFKESIRQFKVAHPNVPKELLDVAASIEQDIAKNRETLYLSKEQTARVAQLRNEITVLEEELGPKYKSDRRVINLITQNNPLYPTRVSIQEKQAELASLIDKVKKYPDVITSEREALITKYGTDKNTSAPLGLDFNQPLSEYKIPTKEEVVANIASLKQRNLESYILDDPLRNTFLRKNKSATLGETALPTNDVIVEVNNFTDLISYVAKSLSGDVNIKPNKITDEIYNNSLTQALIGDGIIGTMAKRTGKTKADIYKSMRFEVTPEQGAYSGVSGRYFSFVNSMQLTGDRPSSIFLHELIHTFDHMGYFTKKERDVLNAWHGKAPNTTAAMEAIAYGFQEYLKSGASVPKRIGAIFNQLKKSIISAVQPLLIYTKYYNKNINLELTKEVETLFGKLIDDGSFIKEYNALLKNKPKLAEPLSKKLLDAGIPLKPAKKGVQTKNRLYQLTKEDVQLFNATNPDSSILSKQDKRLLASEELNDLDPLQLKELNNELNRIYDDSDEGGLLGRKLARLVPDDSIFRPEYTTPEGVTTLIPEDMLSSLNKLESDYNRLADIDLQLANTIKVNPDLEVQRTVLAKQLVDDITKKMGGFELNQKKLVENYNNSLKEAVPAEYKYLVPTPESQKALLSNGAKQRIVTKIMTTDYYKALSQSDKSLLQRTLRGKDGSPELAKQVLKDILNGKTPSILDEVKIEVTPNGKTATKNETDVKTTSKEDIPQTISEIKEDNTVQQDTPTELGDSVGSNDYYTPEQVAKTVNNLRGNAGIIPSRATIDATIADIFKQSNKAGLDYESTIGIMSQFFEDVNIEMNLQTNFGTYNIPSAFSRGTIGRTAESLGINPNSLIHYINQDVVGDGLQKVYKAEAVAAMANHFDNMLKEALTAANKAQDAEYLQRPYNNFPISGNGGTKAKPGLSPTDNLLDVISKIELFTKVVTPDLQKMVEASGLYTSDLNELVKPLQEAKKANALLHDHLPDVAMIEGKKVEMDNPSPITPNDKDSVLEDMYPKSEELVHTKVLQTMIDGKKLAYQQNTFAEVKYKLGELNHLRIQYSNPLRLQLGLGVGKAITSSIAAGLNTAVDTTTSILIGNMVHSTAVMALQFVGGPMGTLYNMQKFSGGLVNTSLASWYYKKTGSNIAKQAGYTQAGAMLEAMAELQAGLGAFKTIGGLWDNIVSTVDTFVQAGKYIPKGGHPMTARHAGSLEPMFRAASKQFDEGSVGRKSVDTLGRWLGAGQKAYATPISYLDSLMTIHTAKVKSRAAVIRDVLLSTEYRDMDFVPGSKESAKYIENKVDEVMPRNYFVWNEATSGAAHTVTFTEPLPKDVGVKNIVQISKEEGIIRSVFGLIDNYAGAIATLVPPLKPYVTLFATVGGNVLNNSVGILGSRDGATFIPAVMGDGTFKVTPYFENLFSTMSDDKTYEAMAFSGGSVGLGILSLLGGWVVAEANKDFFTKKGNFLLNEEDDFPGVELLQTSLGHGYNAITGGYDIDTKVRVGGKLTVNLSQIPAAYFVLPAINLYRELTLIEENHSQQLNENYDTSGNVQAQLDVTAQNAKNIAMMNYVQSVFPIDAAKSFADTGKDAFKAIQETFMLTRDLNKVLSNNGGSELLYNPVTLIGTRAMDPLTQELLYNTLAHKLAPQIKELPTINVKVDTHSGLSVYEAASLLKTGTAMETTIKFPGVYDILGNPRVTTRSSIVKQQPGNTTDTGIQELDRLAKRYPQTNLANNLVFNLHPAGGGSFKPSHTVWGGIQGINGSHIVGATLRNYRLENHSDPTSILYPYNGKTLSQAMRTLINSDAYKNAPDVFLDGDKPLNNPDEVAGRDSKVTMVKTLVNVYHERINEQLIEDPYFSVIESSTSKGVSLKSIVDVEKDPGVDNRPQGMGTGRPAPPELLKQFTDELNQNIKNRL